jgi:hypothetical protein
VKKLVFLTALGAIALLTPSAGTAQSTGAVATPLGTFRVDDTGTAVLEPTVRMQWQPIGRGGASNIVTANTQVSVQLLTVPWIGRSGRIYMTLPATTGATVRAAWTSGGVLLPGQVISGTRALVYAGPIIVTALHDILNIRLEADGSRLSEPQSLDFGFEIEVGQ